MKYHIYGGHKHLYFETELHISSYIKKDPKRLYFETELQISSYSEKDPKRSLTVGRSCKRGYQEIGNSWFESRFIHFHVIGDTISITVSSEEAIMSIREMLENTGIEVKEN